MHPPLKTNRLKHRDGRKPIATVRPSGSAGWRGSLILHVAHRGDPKKRIEIMLDNLQIVAIRSCLRRAIQDTDIFLSGQQKQEDDEKELFELYRQMEAGNTPPEVEGRGQPVRLTEEQQEALYRWTRNGKPLTDEEREAALAGLYDEPISDADARQFARGSSWQESLRQAAVRLRSAGETVQADGIEEELDRLPTEPTNVAHMQGDRDARRKTAETVRAILTAYLTLNSCHGDSPDAEVQTAAAASASIGDVTLNNQVNVSSQSIVNVNIDADLFRKVTPTSAAAGQAAADSETETSEENDVNGSAPHKAQSAKMAGKTPPALVAAESEANAKKGTGGGNRKLSVNARMLETIQKDTDALGWSSPKWAKHLKCAKSSVVATPCWKDLAIRREREKAERAVDRRRQPKGSDLNRD